MNHIRQKKLVNVNLKVTTQVKYFSIKLSNNLLELLGILRCKKTTTKNKLL